ncbi:hypothetical protein [Dyella japonica]|uniref:HEPN AbiU2-like domain-containing protein n=1 Tax=Dyella japonica A8 TaxID=1217721 RepID=A0A075K0P0_9GAMM|nr:hypothetical protein [Dyella japonica]AIF47921.1 hypothetical protein HY57_11945 [Dyella japonica A8]
MSNLTNAMSADYSQLEREFENRLQVFCDEVEAANQYFFAFMTLHAEYAQRAEVRTLFDNHDLVTRTLLSSLQAALFLALGRIFDDRSRHTIHSLLKCANENRRLFSHIALRARKERAAANWAEWIEAFMEGKHEPTDQHFRELRKQIKPHRQVYAEKLDAIRDKWFAHRDSDKDEANKLFAVTSIDQIEKLLGFLIAFHQALWKAYHDGEPLVVDQSYKNPTEARTHLWAPQGDFTIQKRITKQTKEFLDRATSGSKSLAH